LPPWSSVSSSKSAIPCDLLSSIYLARQTFICRTFSLSCTYLVVRRSITSSVCTTYPHVALYIIYHLCYHSNYNLLFCLDPGVKVGSSPCKYMEEERMDLEYTTKNESINIQCGNKHVHRLRLSRLVSWGVNLRMVVRILTRFGLISLCSKN